MARSCRPLNGGKIYYRVTDRIYPASIGDGGIGELKLVLQDPLIEDVHYAFLKRP